MSYRCAITGKGPRAGKQVSHSHRVTKRRFMPNLQKVKVMTEEGPKRMYVSTKALKSGLVRKAS
jgi:large subunit ribosomal protein L28